MSAPVLHEQQPPLAVEVPRMSGINDNLHRVTEETRTRGRPTNTAKAYDGKRKELIEYLEYAWSHDPYSRLLDQYKVYRFIFYQCAREKRVKRRGRRDTTRSPAFDIADYNHVMQKYDRHNHESDTQAQFIQPLNGLKFQAIRQYKAVIKEYFHGQLQHHTRGWEFIWTPRCNVLLNIVRNRGPLQRLQNFEEKVTHALSPFTIVHRYPEIEDKLYRRGMGNTRSAVTQLRNRYVLTHTTSGILRFETLEKACLSDFLCTFIKKEEDVHPLLVMVTQVFTGKTNDTRTIFGRATRHKDVRLCPIGALAFYLALRFHISKEFHFKPPDFFLKNENWFDIRLLANPYSRREDHTQSPLRNDTYSKSIRRVLVDLGLPYQKLKHLGRGLGTKILEADDVQSEYIRQLGNWNLNACDTSYSAKLPMQPIRNAAGFVQGNGLYCNPRTALEVPMDLLHSSPLGNPFLDAHERIKIQVSRSIEKKETPRFTSLAFLNFMRELNIVFFQDAAAMLIKHPERRQHPLYQMPCLSSQLFTDYVTQMRNHLNIATNPYDASIEVVLPGVQERFNGLTAIIHGVQSSVGDVKSSICEMKEAINQFSGTFRDEIKTLHVRALQAAAAAVARSHHFNLDDSTEVAIDNPAPRAVPNRTTNDASKESETKYNLSPQYTSLSLMWDEWYGTGGRSTKDKPIPGGFAQMELMYKTKWRKHFDGAQLRYFTRIRLIIDGINKKAEILKRTPEQILQELEEEWNRQKKSPDGMVKYLQEIGCIKKGKPRGKNTSQHNNDSVNP